ncbi:hypothetical protein PHISP_02162 [Aspergillus sp. HF37]|nr:hypothetical protein PHISP_02162 [Aspergillus sp. HF37]
MKPLTGLFLALTLTFTLISPSTQEWVLVWRNSEPDNATIERGNEPQPCTPINHTEGLVFSWDSHGGPWCVDLWKDRECKNRGGVDCKPYPWKQEASGDILAFDVTRNSRSSSSTLKTTATATAESSTTAAVGTSASATAGSEVAASNGGNGNGNGNGGLSGGEIAGVVIGVVAGAALIASLAFYLGRRRGTGGAVPDTRNYDKAASSKQPVTTEMDKPMAWAQAPAKDGQLHRFPPGTRFVEIGGDNAATELGDTSNYRVVELESPR